MDGGQQAILDAIKSLQESQRQHQSEERSTLFSVSQPFQWLLGVAFVVALAWGTVSFKVDELWPRMKAIEDKMSINNQWVDRFPELLQRINAIEKENDAYDIWHAEEVKVYENWTKSMDQCMTRWKNHYDYHRQNDKNPFFEGEDL